MPNPAPPDHSALSETHHGHTRAAGTMRKTLRRWPHRTVTAVIVVVLILLALRIAAPPVLRHFINQRLGAIEGYQGQVADVDLHLWRGAYQLEGVTLHRRIGTAYEPFLEARQIDFSLAWRELFRGRILSDIAADGLALTYVPVPPKTEGADVTGPAWQDVIADIFPIEITRFTVEQGRLAYRDDQATPKVDIALEALTLTATGLRNRPAEGTPLPASIALSGTTIGGGQVMLTGVIDPLANTPHFDLDAQIENVDLTALNDFLRAYGRVDVSRGTFKAYAELAASDGRFEGYIKPFFDNVSFEDLVDSDKSIGRRLWEKLVSAAASVFENEERDQLGTRIPLSGELSDPNIGLLATLGNLFRHGFIRALTERIENTPPPDAPPPVASPSSAVQPASTISQAPLSK